MKCKDCKYWVAQPELLDEDNEPIGECHRNPPAVFASGNTEWPLLFPREWCGEFAQKLDG